MTSLVEVVAPAEQDELFLLLAPLPLAKTMQKGAGIKPAAIQQAADNV
jgi:hypothetical protein